MANVRHLAPGATDLDRVWGTRPGFYEVFMQDYRRSVARIDPALFELCRLRMATLLGSALDLSLRYQPAVDGGLSEDRIAALSNYSDSPLFTECERLCLGFAELFVIQSSSIGDDDVAKVQEALGAEQFIYFVKALSVTDQLQRSCAAFDVQPGDRVPAALADFRLVETATA
jgi:alkylhydroperoxidase family enzyme